MAQRAFTCLGAGAGLEEAYGAALADGGPVGATTAVRQLDVPPAANASKFATWVQRVAQDPASAVEVPDEHRQAVEQAAAMVTADPATCLAIALEGDLAERTKARAGAAADDKAFLLFGLTLE